MPKRQSLTALIAAFAALAAAAPAARATAYTRMEPVWIDSLAPDGTVDRTVPALLNLPPGWMFGDAAVVVVYDGTWPGYANDHLVAALLGEAAAVLELDVNSARGFSPENARTGPSATAGELLPDLRAAAQTLRRDVGAGLVVAVGQGPGGEAAVLAAASEWTAPPNAIAGFAAGAPMGPGPARFALGGAAVGPGWPVRAGLLCGVLATEAVPSKPDAEAECRRALIGRGEAYAVRAGTP